MPADIAPAFQLASSLRSVRTLSLDEAAAFLHMHPEEVRTRAKRGLIPGAKAGRRWIFLEIDLVEFVRSLYPVRRQALQVTITGGCMSLRKRKKSSVWWIDFVTPNGERVRRSTETANKEAQELHDKLKSEVWRVQRLGDRPKRHLAGRSGPMAPRAGSQGLAQGRQAEAALARSLSGRSGFESINRALIDAIIEAKQAEGCSNATVNRHARTHCGRFCASCARDWEWLDRAPPIRLLKEPTRRIRFLSQTQALTLLQELPPHLRDMATFALATGLRAANVTGLIWEQVDLSRKLAWVHPDQAKAGRRSLCRSTHGDEVVQRQAGKHPDMCSRTRASLSGR